MKFLTLMLALLTAVAHAKEIAETSKNKIPLNSSGPATGSIDFSTKGGHSKFRLKIKSGPANETVHLLVGGVSQAAFETSGNGSLNVTLVDDAIGFDPRGREIEIEDESDDTILSNSTGTAAVDERANLTPTGVQPLASGHATYRLKKGVAQFNAEIEDVTDGTYDILVDGVARGTITTVAGTGELEIEGATFDAVGKLIQVLLNGEVILSGTLLASAPGVSACTPAETTTILTALAGGSGDARYRIRDDCRRDFDVEIEDVPVGDYDLLVAGILRGTIHVAVQPDLSVEGEIEFSTELDEVGELPLDFDPTGATIEVVQGTNVFFSATGGTATTGTCTIVDSEVDFSNVGPIGSAKGKSRLRQDVDCGRDFRVEVEKLPVGSYSLNVDGLLRGTISVVVSNSDTFGEIEFDTEPSPGKLLLDFDPRGLTVEVQQSSNVFLTVTMPN